MNHRTAIFTLLIFAMACDPHGWARVKLFESVSSEVHFLPGAEGDLVEDSIRPCKAQISYVLMNVFSLKEFCPSFAKVSNKDSAEQAYKDCLAAISPIERLFTEPINESETSNCMHCSTIHGERYVAHEFVYQQLIDLHIPGNGPHLVLLKIARESREPVFTSYYWHNSSLFEKEISVVIPSLN